MTFDVTFHTGNPMTLAAAKIVAVRHVDPTSCRVLTDGGFDMMVLEPRDAVVAKWQAATEQQVVSAIKHAHQAAKDFA